MKPRQEFIALFSTFAQFEADSFSSWATDARLRRSMQHCLERSPDLQVTESFWSLYWHKRWKVEPLSLASLHLSAYLQEPGYWSAQQTARKLISTRYTLADYFQIAIAEINTILRDFNPDKGASLKSYANLAFPSLLRDILRQRHEADICTNWTLLRKVSKKRFVESLGHAGLSSTSIAQQQLAWICFKELYVQTAPSTRLSIPDQNFWEELSDFYNRERQSHLTSLSPKRDSETIKQWLTSCAARIRAYLYPSVDSLNASKPGHENEVREVQDDLPATLSESLLSELVAQEDAQHRQTRQVQLNMVLAAALEQLDAQSRQIMHLYYKQGLTQQQIALEVELSQPSIWRRLTKARGSLLATLVQWSQVTLNISLTSNQVEDMSAALEEWLKAYEQDPGNLPM